MSRTNSSDFWSGLRDDVAELGLDVVRHRFIDVETAKDDRNLPDNAALRAGSNGGEYQPAVAGMPITGWLIVGGIIVVGVVVLKRLL